MSVSPAVAKVAKGDGQGSVGALPAGSSWHSSPRGEVGPQELLSSAGSEVDSSTLAGGNEVMRVSVTAPGMSHCCCRTRDTGVLPALGHHFSSSENMMLVSNVGSQQHGGSGMGVPSSELMER